MIFGYLTLFVALTISGVAAWYSIVGLMAIFAASAMSIAIMGSVLEVGKILTASWLYQNWNRVPFLLKSYLTTAVVVLMFITSMGIFGYLSKAHIEQTGDLGVVENQIALLDIQIERQQKDITRQQGALDMLDEALARYTELGAVTKGLQAREEQKPERDALNIAISTSANEIARLEEEKSKLQLKIKAFEVEVGPIRYVSDLLFDDADLERAVRWVILIIIFVFDPLAVLLVIAANMTIRDEYEKKRVLTPEVAPEVTPEVTPKPKPNPNYDAEAEEWFSAVNAEDDFKSDVKIKRPRKWSTKL
jgi:hypothetical protein